MVKGIEGGFLPAPAGSLVRLFHGLSRTERQTVAMEMQGDSALVWNQGESTGAFGVEYVQRQQACIGGGTTEMARNIISERILGMPREPAADRDLPFNQVPRSG